jgi:ketosteroid isomerase-like protein
MRQLLCVLATVACVGQRATSRSEVTADPFQAPRDEAIKATLRYRDAWRANDAALVMATLTRDAVLLPGGLEPIIGEKAIRDFWWPSDGPSTTVISMEQIVDNVTAENGLAIVRGHGSVDFILTQRNKKESRTARHTFLNVVHRQANGSWLIVERMWSDLH